MTQIDPMKTQLRYVTKELEGLRKVISYLMGDDEKYRQKAFAALYFLKSNYKDWGNMMIWLKRNNLRGQKLVEFFQNESPDGGGYHMGATKIISMLEGMKHQERTIKVNELIGG